MNIQSSQYGIQNGHGVRAEVIDVVCLYADRVIHLNNGTYVLSLTTGLIQELRSVLGGRLISRCERIQLVVDAASSEVISVAKNAKFRQGRHRPLRRKRSSPSACS